MLDIKMNYMSRLEENKIDKHFYYVGQLITNMTHVIGYRFQNKDGWYLDLTSDIHNKLWDNNTTMEVVYSSNPEVVVVFSELTNVVLERKDFDLTYSSQYHGYFTEVELNAINQGRFVRISFDTEYGRDSIYKVK